MNESRKPTYEELEERIKYLEWHGIWVPQPAKKVGDKCNCKGFYHAEHCANWVMCD